MSYDTAKRFYDPKRQEMAIFDFDTTTYYQIVLTAKVEKLAVFGGIFEFQIAVENFLGVVTP